MENYYSLYSGQRSDSGARLRPSLAAESLVGPAPYPTASRNAAESNGGNTWGGLQGRREYAHSMESSSRSHRSKPSGAERPTSPAFMKLLSQRSPKTPSQGSRSPSVMSQISGRRRVSSPAIAARAWMDPCSSPPNAHATYAQALGGSPVGPESCKQETESPESFTVLSRSRGRAERKKNREESTDHRRRRSNSNRGHGHRRSQSKSKRETHGKKRKEGAVLSPVRKNADEIPCKAPPRPPPKKVMSPRRLPPPTFEKILLGLVDDDFTSGNDEVDVFGAEERRKMQESGPPFSTQTEEECISVSVERTNSIQDEMQNSTPFSPQSSPRSSLEKRFESRHQHDGVIPEHYLYIPPLRICGNSTEERRPVPALIQPTEDEGQVSVREDRRHIATLFSLDAAESQAQKARLQEQLRETSPFRLTEVGGSSSASQSDGVEIIGPPPGQSKRRQRSTLLETIVREHDWEAEEQTFEENIRIYPEQQDQAQEPQAPEASQWHFLASDEEEGDGESTRGKLPDADPSSPRPSEQESVKLSDEAGAAAQPDSSPELRPEECDNSEDVPGAFDAVWGRTMRSSQAANDSQSKASSQTDDGGDLHDLYNAEMAAHGLKMVDFLSATSLHSEDSDAESGGSPGAAEAEKNSDAASSVAGTGTKNSSLTAGGAAADPAGVRRYGNPGTARLLHVGDTTGWELRYSTPDVLPRSAKQPASTGARSVDSDTQEDTTQRAEEDQGQTVEFEEEEEVQKDTHTDAYRPCEEEREVSLSLFPEDPPSTTRREQAGKHMLDSTRMSSYSSTRLVSIGNCELSRSVANEAAAGRYVTSELQLAAATLDTRLRSVQSIASEDAPTEGGASRRSFALTFHCRKSASRKRQRTVKEEGPVAPDASSRTGERATEEWAEAPETTCVRNSTAQVFFSEVENCSFGQSQGEKLPCTGMLPANRAQPPAAAAGAAAAAAAEVKAAAEHKTPWARVKEPLQVEARNSSEDTATVEADAWHEGSTVPAHDAENEADDQESSRGVCEGDFSGPLHHYSVSLSPCRSSDPATSRSTEVFETISRAISGCAYGPRLHLLILSCMFLAAWALLTLIYLLEGGRGSRFFVGLAVALSFVLSLCTGAVQLTASLVKWKALKCSLDMDLRERIFASLKRLQLEEEAGDQSSEGKKECGKLLHLLCSSFAGLITHGSPGLDVSRTMERRFIAAHTFSGIVAAAFIAGLVCSGEAAAASRRLEFQAGDAVAVVAAFLYSILLLALSYYLATPPSPAAVRRSVELHSAFQYLWSLKFADFLLERRVVTSRSVNDLRLPSVDARHSFPFISSLNPRSFKPERGAPAVCFRGAPNPVRSKYITAKVVLRHPAGVQFDCFKNLRKGQRVLLTLTSAPRQLNTIGSPDAPAVVYLNLIWCGRRAAPEELRIRLPSYALSACAEVAAAGRKPGGTSTSTSVQRHMPQFVICSLLDMLHEDSTDAFVNSQICRYLSEAETQLGSASCEYALVLPLPLSAFNCGRRWHCGVRALKSSTESASSCCMLRYFGRLGWSGGSRSTADHKVNAVEPDEEHVERTVRSKDQLNGGGKTTERVGHWKVQSPPIARHTRSVQMHAYGKQQLNGIPTVNQTQQALYPHERSDAPGVSEASASLTLFFASEEQRQEFKRCIQEAIVA